MLSYRPVSHAVACPPHRTPPSALALCRLAAGLRQADVAREAQINREHISRLERGVCRPRLDTARRLADVLGVQPEAIFPAHNVDGARAVDTSPVGKEGTRVITTDDRRTSE